MKMSIDRVDKVEAQTFGYIINDFREIETITLWTDILTLEKLKTLKK